MNKETIEKMKAETIGWYKMNPDYGTGVRRHVGFDDNGDYLMNLVNIDGKPFSVRKIDVENKYHKVDPFDYDSLEFVTCPQIPSFGPYATQADNQYWETEVNGDKTCSGCGSWHPQQYLDWLATAADPETQDWLEPSDKGYKHYVNRPGISNAGQGAIKCYMPHVAQYVKEKGLNIEELDKKIHDAILTGRKKFAAKFGRITD